jgi:hypothetical protein
MKMGKIADLIRQMHNDGMPMAAIIAAVEAAEDGDAKRAAKEFSVWYDLYPHKVGRADALKAFTAARKVADLDMLIEGVRAYVETKRPDTPWCNPGTWLRQQRWLDRPAAPPTPAPRGIDRVRAELQQEIHDAGYGGQEGSDSGHVQRFSLLPREGH